jgi:transposase
MTVYHVKRRFLNEGLETALSEKPRSGKPVQISGEARARITALACSDAPRGHARWTLRLLADKSVELGFVDSISHNHIRQILKKTNSDHI